MGDANFLFRNLVQRYPEAFTEVLGVRGDVEVIGFRSVNTAALDALFEKDAVDWLKVSETLRTAFEKGEKLGIEKGEKLGIEKALRRLFKRRLGRDLTPSEVQALAVHVSAGFAEQATDRAFSLEGEALAQWLLDSEAT